ncbi:Exostosin family protein [Flavobacterium gillisiae]|uniref:Exostosin family protein n=1 Tax=Flavobacterium gillisiae TaxID=150146 RepID=A0A1H4EWG3_9FLAO|nr:hypothetical protein [Flavobacterium gillisiae]SEA89335.1 Exostosin family protein [Flavobacterium gillisiae]
MLKLYTDEQYLTPENRSSVFPLLFDLYYTHNLKLLEKYQIVSRMEDCDIAVVPVDVAHFDINNKMIELNGFVDQALALQKKVWVYTAGDYGLSMDRLTFTFRMGGFDSKLNSNTVILPSFISDPYSLLQKEFKAIPKAALPRIGFVGNASNSLIKRVKEVFVYLRYNYKRLTKQLSTDYQAFYPSSIKRYHFLSLLLKSNKVETDFIFRKKYRAGIKTAIEKQKTTLEFFLNMEKNPYNFCLRGAGNFSVRLYETLAMGRIPVVVDTDMRLPLNIEINWPAHCVFVSKDSLEEDLISFHNTISEQIFILMQENNRKLWVEYLEREAYFSKLHSLFKN